MNLKKAPQWEGTFGNWEFSWGYKHAAARHTVTKQILTAAEICLLAFISARQEKDGHYVITIATRPATYETMCDKGLIDLRLVNGTKIKNLLAAYWEEVTILCDVLEYIPIPYMINSLLVEAGWNSAWHADKVPDQSDVAQRPNLWRTIEVWMTRLTTSQLPEYITHPHFLMRQLANTIVQQREDVKSFRGQKYLLDPIISLWY